MTPSIGNPPASAVFDGNFTASVVTDSDGVLSVTSTTTSVCTVGVDGLTVSFIGVGSCTLTAHAAASATFSAADGLPQTFSVGQATPLAPSISDVPGSAVFGGGFTASVVTNSDGIPSVTSSTPSTCTVGVNGLTVSFVGAGSCTLTAHVAAGTDFVAADGVPQPFPVSPSTGTTASISPLPTSATFGGGFTASVITNGDGAKSVTSSTPPVCTVGGNHLSVSYVGAGTCTLVAHVAAGVNFGPADGTPQSFTVDKAVPSAPSISNLPAHGIFGGGFVATVDGTNGDGVTSVVSNTPATCAVSSRLTVSYVGAGTCSLSAQVAAGDNYLAASGSPQTISIARATPTTPTITNLPTAAVEFAGFTADIGTNGDGPTSVVSSTPGVCAVQSDGQTVLFDTTGACTLTPSLGTGVNFVGATGSPQTFQVGGAPRGYWLVGSDGGIFSFGAAAFSGSTGAMVLQRPVVGITPTLTRGGYWLVASDGGLFSFGDASFFGSIPGIGLHPAGSGLPQSLSAPIVGMVPSTNRRGYFMVASDGGVFAFGDAKFEGSCPGIGGCVGAAVAVMPDRSGNGYWLVTNAGRVYAFGDAPPYGSPGPQSVPVVNGAATPDGMGYWLLYSNGIVVNYGDAVNFGSPNGYVNAYNPANAIFPTADGKGYWVASTRGDVFAYGNAPWLGSMTGKALNGQIIAGFGF